MSELLEGAIREILDRMLGRTADARYAVLNTSGAVLALNFTPEDLPSVKDRALSLAQNLKPGKFSLDKDESGAITLFFRSDEDTLVVVRAVGKPPGVLLLCAKAISKKIREARQVGEVTVEIAPTPEGVIYELAPEFKSADDVLKAMPSIGVLSGSPLLMFSILSRLEKGPANIRALAEFVEEKYGQVTEIEILGMLEFLENLGIVKKR